MDFNYSEEQEAVRQLAGQIFGERATHERLKAVEAAAGDEGPIDRDLWRELARRGPDRDPSQGRRRRRRARLRGCLSGVRGRGADGGIRPRCRDHGLWSGSRRPVRYRGPAQDVAERCRERRDDPHRRTGRAGGGGRTPRRSRADHGRRGAVRRIVAALRHQGVRAGQRLSPMPSWFPPPAARQTARAPAPGSSSSTPLRRDSR